MDNGRNYIIDRLKSRKVTIDEFNFDKLSAPPLAMFFTPYDIQELNGIARSIKYSGKLDVKLKMIDDICRRRGLVKFGSGTNRVVYRHPEFNTILFKIAYDYVALEDNINEFRNQYILKPFVAKTFEVSPCGTVAIVERVRPIRSREEFISIADDVFTLLNDFIIGNYIMADIGCDYFCNYGLREESNFGPVLLDYSFLYELDENKIYCNKPDPTSVTGLCEGEICYDDGFNNLYCNKCGAKYKAVELKKKIKDNEIIVTTTKGDNKMKVKVSGGSINANKVVSTENANCTSFKETVENIIANANVPEVETNRKVYVNLKDHTTRVEEKVEAEPVRVETEEPKAVNGVSVSTDEDDEYRPSEILKEFLDELDRNVTTDDEVEVADEGEPVEEYTEVADEGVAAEVTVHGEGFSPISVDVNKINEAAIEVPAGKNPVELIDEAVDSIIENLNSITIDVVKNDAMNRMVSKIISNIPNTGEMFNTIMSICESIFDNTEDDNYIDIVHSEKFIRLISRIFDPVANVTNIDRDGANLNIEYNIGLNYSYNNEDVACVSEAKAITIEDVFTTDEEEVADEDTDKATYEEQLDPTQYNGIRFANGTVVETTSIFPFPDVEKEEIIVGIDEDGNYVTDSNGMIIGYNIINDCEVNTVDIVSKEWVNSVSEMLNNDTEETQEDEVVEEVSEE